MSPLVHLIIYLLVIGAVFYILYWAIQQVPLPAPFAVVAKVLLAIVAVLILLDVLLPMAGSPSIGCSNGRLIC